MELVIIITLVILLIIVSAVAVFYWFLVKSAGECVEAIVKKRLE